MYLFLVDYNFISSEQLQKMIGQIMPGADIVNCFSTDTLLKISEKLLPDIIIIDYDLVEDDQAGLIESIREKSKGAHILALIDPDFYEKLYSAIGTGAVDDYMVKPVRKEDFMARIYIASKRKGLAVEELPKDTFHDTDQSSVSPELDYDDDSEAAGETFDEELFVKQVNAGLETTPVSDHRPYYEDEQVFEDEETGDPEAEYISPYEEVIKPSEELEAIEEECPIIEEESPELDEETPAINQVSSDSEEKHDGFNEIELFEEEDSEKLPELEELAEDPVLDYETDYFAPESGEKDQLDAAAAPEADAPGYDLFDEKKAEKAGQDSFTSLFGDEPDHKEPEQDDENFKSFEDTKLDEQEEAQDDGVFSEESFEPKSGPGPAVVKPAAEFLGEDEEIQQEGSETVSDQEFVDNQYFDDLFSDESPGESSAASMKETPPDFEAPGEIESSTESVKNSRGDRIRYSDLPGESADAFLYGENNNDQEEPDETPVEEPSEDKENETVEEPSEDKENETEDEIKRRDRKKKDKSSKGWFSRFFSIFGNIVFVMLLLFMATLSFFLIQSRISGGAPQVAGYQMYIVLSGSMSPEFDTGSLAFVREAEPEQIVIGDIITYRTQPEANSLTTHRVVEVIRNDGLRFITRGDANNINDPNPVLAENVVGRVTGSVPYVGYILNYVQTREGLILLIFVPGVLIIAYEMSKIVKYLAQGQKSKTLGKGEKHPSLAEK